LKVLIVDDDADLLDLMTYALRREGYTVIGAVDGEQAIRRWEGEKPDIILLDAGLPKLNGFEVCRKIRNDSDTPIIMLTARDEEEDVLRGFRLGADDYVPKPFSAKQLAMRMKAVLRRCEPDPYRHTVSEVREGDLVLDLQSHEATRAAVRIQLTPLEFRIAYMLAMNAGRVVPYSRLIEYGWGYDGGDSGLLKTHICHLRQKLRLPPRGVGSLRAVAGVGYKMERA